jgi:hypothetical protein
LRDLQLSNAWKRGLGVAAIDVAVQHVRCSYNARYLIYPRRNSSIRTLILERLAR